MGTNHLDVSRDSLASDGQEPSVGGAAVALAAAGVVGILTMLVLGPIIFSEAARDWTTYQDAADRLRAGAPLYISGGELLYIYPPPLAAVWALGMTPAILLVAKVIALVALAWVVGWPLGVPAVALLLLTPSLDHDVVLGNVMVFYALGLTWSALRPGVTGSIVLGTIIALAAKPVLGPYLVWLLLVRRRDFGWTVGSAVVISAAFALVLGPGRYLEYVVALPEAGRFASAWHGNLGLSFISPLLGTLGVVIAYVLALVAAWRGEAGLPVVIGALLLAQPSYGVAYGLLLLPAVVYLWRRNQIIAVTLASGLPLLLGLSYAPLAGVITSAAGLLADRLGPAVIPFEAVKKRGSLPGPR